MKKKFSKILGVGLALVLACSFGLVPAAPVLAVITPNPTIEPVAHETDDVAGKENAAYQISYDQNTTGAMSAITVTFPDGYTIPDGDLGTAAVRIAADTGFVTIGGNPRAVDNVIGNSTGRTIAIVLVNPYIYVGTETVEFQIVLGITNPILIGPYGTAGLTVDDDATGNDAVEAASAVTIIAAAVYTLTVEVQPSETVAGVAITPPVQVKAEDEFTNVIDGKAIIASLLVGAGELTGTLTETTDPSGIATFANLVIDLTGDDQQLQFAANGATVDSVVFGVIPGAADETTSTITAAPVEIVANGVDASTITVQLKDSEGNDLEAGDDTVELATTLGTLSSVADNADGTYTAALTGTVIGVATISGKVNTYDITTGAATVTLISGAATQVRVETQADGGGAVVGIQDVISGNSITVYAVTRDVEGNFVGNVAADSWSLIDIGGEVVDGDLTNPVDSKSAVFKGALVGTAVIHATSGGLISVDSGIITVIVGTAAKLAFFQEPTETVAGAIISPVIVEIVDAGGNRITTATDEIIIAATGPGTMSGDIDVNAVDGMATFNDLWIDKTGNYTLEATSGGLDSALSAGFDITPAVKATIAFVRQPTDTGAGETISPPGVTVEFVDGFGNRTSDTDNITIVIDTNPGDGTLSGIATVAAVEGLAPFSLSIDKLGTGYTLEATAEGLTEVTSASFNITVGTAASLVFVGQPTDAIAGEIIPPVVTVKIVDAYGNQTADTDVITIAILNNPSVDGLGALSGLLPVAASDGLATFDTLWIDKTGEGYTLQATAVGLNAGDSAAFDITPAEKYTLAFVQQPTTTVAGETISPPGVTVEIVDEFGNRTSDTDVITIVATGPGELLGTLEVPADAGLATFSDLSIEETGSYTLEAATNPNGLDSGTSAGFDITPAAVFAIDVVAAEASIVVGETITITATLTDEYENLVAETEVSFATTLGMVSPVTDATVSGKAETTLKAGSRAGTATVTATAGGESGTTTVVFTPLLVVARITVIAEPASIPVGSTSLITVTLVDEHGNTVPTAGATVLLETTAGTLNPVSGATVAGVFISTLTSSFPPTTATVTADVVGMFSGSVEVDFYPPLEPNQIGLQAGWNAISLPLIPNNSSIEVVLDGVLANVEVVWAYDPISRPLDPWFSWYIPEPEEPAPDLTEMEDGVGYWVKMSAGAILTVTGVIVQPDPPEAPKTYPVVEGWNFIGFKSLNPMHYDFYLSNIAENYSVILGYGDSRFYNVHPLLYQPVLRPGSGYWIFMTADGIIVPLD